MATLPQIPDLADREAYLALAGLCSYGRFAEVLDRLNYSWDRLFRHESLRAELFRMRATCQDGLGRLPEALRDTAQSLKYDPDQPGLRETLRTLQNRAVDVFEVLFKQDRWPELLKLSEAYISTDGPAPIARYCQAVALDHLGRSEEAVSILKLLVVEVPYRPEHWKALANTLQGLGRIDEALEALERGIGFLASHGMTELGRLQELLGVLQDQKISRLTLTHGFGRTSTAQEIN